MAKITKETINGYEYLRANNLLLSDSEHKTNSFTFIYKAPATGTSPGKTYIHTCVPVGKDPMNVHALWFALKEAMTKAPATGDINPYKVVNRKKDGVPEFRDVLVKEDSVVVDKDRPALRTHQLDLFKDRPEKVQSSVKRVVKAFLRAFNPSLMNG